MDHTDDQGTPPSHLGRRAVLIGGAALLADLAVPRPAHAAVGTWRRLYPDPMPSARASAALAPAPDGGLLLFGGYTSLGTAADDTWHWDGRSWQRREPAVRPAARSSAALALHPGTGRLVLFGGAGLGGRAYDDTWTYDGATWRQLFPGASPSERYAACLERDRTGRLVLFGGFSGDVSTPPDASTWAFTGSTWRRLAPTRAPQVRYAASCAYDAHRGETVLFGGSALASRSEDLGDTWVWNGSDWTRRRPTTSPPPRRAASLAYDPASRRVVLFGGYDDRGDLDDTWAWDGRTWTRLSLDRAPSGRGSAALAHDPVGGGLLLFGGGGSGERPDAQTWRLRVT